MCGDIKKEEGKEYSPCGCEIIRGVKFVGGELDGLYCTVLVYPKELPANLKEGENEDHRA
jgi:hypothetical protein